MFSGRPPHLASICNSRVRNARAIPLTPCNCSGPHDHRQCRTLSSVSASDAPWNGLVPVSLDVSNNQIISFICSIFNAYRMYVNTPTLQMSVLVVMGTCWTHSGDANSTLPIFSTYVGGSRRIRNECAKSTSFTCLFWSSMMFSGCKSRK